MSLSVPGKIQRAATSPMSSRTRSISPVPAASTNNNTKAAVDAESILGAPLKLRKSTSHSSMVSLDAQSAESIDDLQDGAGAEYDEKPSAAIEEELFKAVSEENRAEVNGLLQATRPSVMLKILLTFSYINRSPIADFNAASKASMSHLSLHAAAWTVAKSISVAGDKRRSLQIQPSTQQRPYFKFDADIIKDAHELLGTSTSPLNFIQIACLMGDEEMALDILDYVYNQTVPNGQKLLLMEFMGKTWGDGNTVLHLASFQGMSDLVERLLEYGANTGKTNGRGYKPVDVADGDGTGKLFRMANNIAPRLRSQSAESDPGRANIMSPVQKMKQAELSKPASAPSSQDSKIVTLDKIPASAGITSSDSLNIKAARSQVIWEPNCLLLDYAKNGELLNIQRLVAKSKEIAGASKAMRSKIYAPTETLDINCRTPHTGLTPLHMASAYGHLDVVKYLIEEAHADIHVRDSDGWSILHSIIAEIPDPETFPNSVTEEEKADRVRFLKVFNYLLQLPDIEMQAVSDDGESILDVIKEIDENGNPDQEVYDLLQSAMLKRGVKLRAQTTEDEDESGSESDCSKSPLPLRALPPKPSSNYSTTHGNGSVKESSTPRQPSSLGSNTSSASTNRPLSKSAPPNLAQAMNTSTEELKVTK